MEYYKIYYLVNIKIVIGFLLIEGFVFSGDLVGYEFYNDLIVFCLFCE